MQDFSRLHYRYYWVSPAGLLIALTLGSGVLSAFFLNDTLAMVLTPLTQIPNSSFKLESHTLFINNGSCYEYLVLLLP
jgi:Na+/H+ antiporter NhaD/arsenite permease-like protein